MSLYTGSLDGDRLFPFHSRHARAVVYRWSERYLGRRVRPHALRHSYALYLLGKTGSLELVKRLLGHTSSRWVKAYGRATRVEPRDLLAEAFQGSSESRAVPPSPLPARGKTVRLPINNIE